MTRLLQLFAVWDTDGDGTIGPREFERALIALGLVPSRDDARKLFELLDQDESGAVSVEELIRLKSAIEAREAQGRGARAEGSAAEQSRVLARQYAARALRRSEARLRQRVVVRPRAQIVRRCCKP